MRLTVATVCLVLGLIVVFSDTRQVSAAAALGRTQRLRNVLAQRKQGVPNVAVVSRKSMLSAGPRQANYEEYYYEDEEEDEQAEEEEEEAAALSEIEGTAGGGGGGEEQDAEEDDEDGGGEEEGDEDEEDEERQLKRKYLIRNFLGITI